MTSPALQMLLERLLWPVPRVRWEVSRSLAHLIRETDGEAASGLLNWISTRKLESEAVLALGIIDAFDLGAYFEFADVLNVVRAPSHLSDWLLKRNFTDASDLIPSRYAISPSEPASLPQHKEAWFDRYRKSAVPPIFSDVLTQLQQSTGLPFRKRWKHDWRWLCATHPRPAIEYPYFFVGADDDRYGQFDHGQRELFVSAYLRTLAFASRCGSMPDVVAEKYAMLALTMNRGLADLEPIDRPVWARNILPCEDRRMKAIAQKLWVSAGNAAQPDEVPLALRVVDFTPKGFVEFDMTLTIGPSGFADGPAEAETLDYLMANERPGEMTGLVGQKAGIGPRSIEHPLAMTQCVLPEDIGRVHAEMAPNIRLASPHVFETSANIQCGPTEIRLDTDSDVLSRWVHWYADWEPTISRELDSVVGSMTAVSKSRLDNLRTCSDLAVALLVRVRQASRSEFYTKHEAKSESYWM